MYMKSFFFYLIFQSIDSSKDKKYNEPEKVIYIVIIISGIIFLFNIFGIIKLCQIDHKIKFEEWVLISGIIELSLMIFYLKYKRYEILLTIVETLQNIIILFITRRFLKSYFLLSNSKLGSFCYNSYYLILIIVNILFTILSVVFDLLSIYFNKVSEKEYEFLNNIISFIYAIFSLFTSFILLIIGLKLKRIMIKINEFEEENKNEDKFIYEEYNPSNLLNTEIKSNNLINENSLNKETGISDTGNFTIVTLNIEEEDIKSFSPTYFLLKETSKEIHMSPEIFLNIRIKQLNIYIWITFITDFLSLIILFFKTFYLNYVKFENGEIFPRNEKSYYIILLLISNIIINTFMNWYTLYFIVRNTFPIKNINKNNEVDNNENIKMFDQNQLNKTNKSIDNFLNID